MGDQQLALTYGQLTSEQKVYLFEFIFSEALRQVLSDAEFDAWTAYVVPDFQKERGRVEVIFVPGPGQGIWKMINGEPRERAWKGQFVLHAITQIDQVQHGIYVGQLRTLMAKAGSLINGTDPMQFHKLQPFFMDAGTSAVLTSDDGYYMTTLNYNVDFSIQDNAWALLTT